MFQAARGRECQVSSKLQPDDSMLIHAEVAETLIGRSSIASWDGSTRGLDSSTALDFARSLRILTDVSRRTSIATLYQAGEGIYEVRQQTLKDALVLTSSIAIR